MLDQKDPRKDQGVGDEDNATSLPLEKRKRRNVGRLLCESKDGKQRRLVFFSAAKNKKMRSGLTITVHELSSLGSSSREKPSRDSESEQIRILLDRQRDQILADCQAEIRKHEFQADYDRRSIQKLSEMIESKKNVVLIKETNDFDEIINFFMSSY